MARFWGSILGNRGMATRLGTKGTGMEAHAHAWSVGGIAITAARTSDDADVVTLLLNGGSGGYSPDVIQIGSFTAEDYEILRKNPNEIARVVDSAMRRLRRTSK